MIIKNIIATIFLSLILFIPKTVIPANLDWLLDCSYRGNDFHYFKEIDKLKNGSVPKNTVSVELNRQLPKIFLGGNFECIYEPILFFGNESTITHFKKRAQKPKPYDRPGYASDLLKLLISRPNKYNDKGLFMKKITAFNYPVSIKYFLYLHLEDLPFQARLDVMWHIIKKHKLPGRHAYGVPEMMRKIYKENPEAYDTFVESLSGVPDEFTCFKDETCP